MHVQEESGATPSKVKAKVEAKKKVQGSRKKSLRTPPEPRQETPSNVATEKKTPKEPEFSFDILGTASAQSGSRDVRPAVGD